MKKWIKFYSFSFTRVTLRRWTISIFSSAITSVANYIFFVIYCICAIFFRVNDFIKSNLDLYFDIFPIPPHWIGCRLFFVSFFILTCSLFPHIKIILINKIVIVHKALFSSFMFTPFHFFRVRVIIIVSTLLTHAI